MSRSAPSCIIYSCSFGDYDNTFGPLARTPGVQFLRFGTTRPTRWRIWEHLPVPKEFEQPTQALTNRTFKMFPHKVLPECDIAIYVDGNILIRADLTPLIEEFWQSGADIALFPHPSGRSLEEEIDFALSARIPKDQVSRAEAQRVRYREAGLLEVPITENSIIFYRMASPKIAEIAELWWDELDRYSKRDQISLPYVMDQVVPKVHLWDWHFAAVDAANPYFARYRHRFGDRREQLQSAGYFMKDYAIEYRLLHAAFVGLGALRRGLTRPLQGLLKTKNNGS